MSGLASAAWSGRACATAGFARAALALALIASAAAAQDGDGALDVARLEAVADSVAHHAIASKGTPALSVAVAKDGRIVFARGYGEADVENAVAARPETVYRIGSVTKQFTSAIVMRLVEAGRLSLDDSLGDFVPDFDTQGHEVTVKHLLNHTSGIYSYTSLGPDAWSTSFRHDLSDAELVALIADHPFDFEPGAEQRYNNTAYFMLGMVIEAVTSVPYARYLEDELLRPLGLERTFYCDVDRIVHDRAEGYEYEDGTLVNATFLSMNVPGAAGAMCSTVEDLIAWTRMLHAGEVVSQASLAAMTTPTAVAAGDTIPYGFGLAVGDLEGHRSVSHGGGINGFSSALAHYPDDGVTVAVLTNSGSGPASDVAGVLARVALGVELPRVADLPLPADEVPRFVGTYRLELGERTLDLRVFEREGQPWAQAEGQSAHRLRWQGETTFVPTFDDEVRLVFELEGERAVRVVLHQGGGAFRGERVR